MKKELTKGQLKRIYYDLGFKEGRIKGFEEALEIANKKLASEEASRPNCSDKSRTRKETSRRVSG